MLSCALQTHSTCWHHRSNSVAQDSNRPPVFLTCPSVFKPFKTKTSYPVDLNLTSMYETVAFHASFFACVSTVDCPEQRSRVNGVWMVRLRN